MYYNFKNAVSYSINKHFGQKNLIFIITLKEYPVSNYRRDYIWCVAWDRGFQGESFLFASRWAGIPVKGLAHKTELYSKWYQKSPLCVIYSRHIILCGYITKQSVETFLRDFLHKDRSNTSINAVIMGKWVLLLYCIKCNLKVIP